MFRTPKAQAPQKISRKKHLPTESTSSLPQTVNPTLQMQSLIGNHATQQMMIQRMPTSATIKTILGEPKKDQKIGIGKYAVTKANSTKYQYVLNVVKYYEDYLDATTIAGTPDAITAQFKQALSLLDNITTTAASYDSETGKKAVYMKNTLKPEVLKEKTNVATSLASILHNPTLMNAMKNFKLKGVIKKEGVVTLLERNVTGNDRGGASEVTKFGGNKPGYFKETKGTLANWNNDNERDEFMNAAKVGADDPDLLENMLDNEKRIAVDLVGINPEDAHMANRDVAMSRLNQLLGANVIAKAEMAVRHTAQGEKTGSLMEDATKKGKSAFDIATAKEVYDPAAGEAKGAANQMSLQDPELMRQLSRLQLIDLLALQVDRNTKNYFVQVSPTGAVLGVTGIDNDLSMGTNDRNETRQMELPGFSRYVDEELANAILNLDPEILASLMGDLLSKDEIAALLSRLKKLQAFLKPLKDQNQLLKPNQWTAAIAQNLLVETPPKSLSKKSYYAQFVEKAKGQSDK